MYESECLKLVVRRELLPKPLPTSPPFKRDPRYRDPEALYHALNADPYWATRTSTEIIEELRGPVELLQGVAHDHSR